MNNLIFATAYMKKLQQISVSLLSAALVTTLTEQLNLSLDHQNYKYY